MFKCHFHYMLFIQIMNLYLTFQYTNNGNLEQNRNSLSDFFLNQNTSEIHGLKSDTHKHILFTDSDENFGKISNDEEYNSKCFKISFGPWDDPFEQQKKEIIKQCEENMNSFRKVRFDDIENGSRNNISLSSYKNMTIDDNAKSPIDSNSIPHAKSYIPKHFHSHSSYNYSHQSSNCISKSQANKELELENSKLKNKIK